MTDIFLYQGDATPSNVVLSDPTVLRGASAVSMALAAIEGADLCSAAMDLVAASSDMSLAAVEGADTASGAVALVQSMILAATEGADLVSASMALAVSMALSAVDGADLCAASMDVVAAGSVDMALDATEGADTCVASMDSVGSSDQSKDGGGGSHWKHKPTAGAGLRVPYRHEKPVDEFGYEIDEPSVPATPLAQPSAPIQAPIAAGPTELDLAIAPPYREPVTVPTKLQVKVGPSSAETLKAKHNDHALRLLLLAS